METPPLAVTIDDIRDAARLLEGAVIKTPMSPSRVLSKLCGCEIVLKFENLQYTASFKDRGAYVKLASLTEEQKQRGVIAMSAGNHAQGVAYHAQTLGIPATIVMPRQTPFNKVIHTRNFGARVILRGDTLDDSATVAHEIMDQEGLTFIHPFDDPKIIAGQGTIALEMLEADPELDTIVCPIGGGGLISGIAIAAKAIKPEIEIVGVEATLYPSMYQALHHRTPTSGGTTIAEGIAVKTPGALTRPIVEALVERILLVEEAALERAVLMLIEIEKTVAEGAGAAGLAAVLTNKEQFAGRRVGLVICGGNIDSRILATILMRGLALSGRLARFRIEITDQPGALAKVAGLIGESAGNIVEVYHQRLFYDVPVKMADLDVVVETRDPEHIEEIVNALTGAGYPARVLGGTAATA
ncbi:MAG: threonine ammonia-lyase [Alphaproteobacteria bacterium]|nr:threonine ammonia-lyase [Alphaproteobacteria bacterium]